MKHKIGIFFAIIVVVLLSQMFIGSASAISINGWTNAGQPGSFDLYITPDKAVNAQELCQLVNYQDTATTIKVIDPNGTAIYTQNIDPHSSMYIQLPFPDINKAYTIKVINSGYTELTMTKSQPAVMPIIPGDTSSWRITPPSQDNGGAKQFTQAFVDGLIAMLTLQVFASVMIAVVGGVLLGAMVKRAVLFFAPNDIISIMVYIFVVSDLLFNWTKFGIGIYYLPFLVGYLLGFMIARFFYVMVNSTNLEEKSSNGQPFVLYSPNDEIGVCIQQQSNKALVKRWLGYHHRLGMDGGLSADWADSRKYPYFPRFRRQFIEIEDSVTEYDDQPFFFGWINIRVYTTYWHLSNCSKFPKIQWKKSSAAIIRARDLIERLYSDLVTGRQNDKMDATHAAAELLMNTMERSTHRAIYKRFLKPEPPLTIPESHENQMRPTTKRLASPQQMPEDKEPEKTERPVKRENEIEEESEPDMERRSDESTNKKNSRRNQ